MIRQLDLTPATVQLSVGQLYAAGTALVRSSQPDLAVGFFRGALSAVPDDPSVLSALAGAERELGRYEQAEETARRALALEPTTRRRLGLAAIVRDQRRDAESEELAEEALAADPDSADAAGFVGIWLLDRWRERDGTEADLSRAGELLERAVAMEPLNLSFQEGRLVHMQVTGQHDRWQAAAEELAARWPEVFRFQLHKAFALLKRGDWSRALPCLAVNIRHRPDIAKCPLLEQPEWWPNSARGGPVPLIVWNTDGVGDCIQFARYFKLAARDGAQVRLICNQPEARLFARCPGVAEIIPAETEIELGRYATSFGLGAAYTTRESEIPWDRPYLSAPPELVEKWLPRLHFRGLRVGVCWTGNPKQENNRRRSFRPELLAALVGCRYRDARFYSLQKGERGWFHDLGDEYQAGDWLETAAVIANLDLVIAPCTGVAHLAAAMGKPVWLALSEPGCWRWGIGRPGVSTVEPEDSPWYPTLRIFRQTVRGSWDGVFERMAAELRKLVEAKAA